MSRSKPKSKQACANRNMKWIARHKSKSAKGKRINVRASCRKKNNAPRSMYGIVPVASMGLSRKSKSRKSMSRSKSRSSSLKKARKSKSPKKSRKSKSPKKARKSKSPKKVQMRKRKSSNPKSRKSCSARSMKWIVAHKSKSAKGKSIKVRGSCRKRNNSRK